MATPAHGWRIGHQIAHLAWTDEMLVLALSAPEKFAALRRLVLLDGEGAVDAAARAGAAVPPAQIKRRWIDYQQRATALVRDTDPSLRVPWFGPAMGLSSAVSARIMETFAHGQDIRDALGVGACPSRRLRHVAYLAVAARSYSFQINGLRLPTQDVRVELSYQDEMWAWGGEEAKERVSGPALDFALLATRRRHVEDVSVSAVGPIAEVWLSVIQGYAGPPGKGRNPLANHSPH
jgi:uncharacterized protein (TIGR03084 family)